MLRWARSDPVGNLLITANVFFKLDNNGCTTNLLHWWGFHTPFRVLLLVQGNKVDDPAAAF